MKIHRKFFEAIEAVITALLYWLFAYYVIYITLAAGRPIVAYGLNLVFIVIVLVMDKFADGIMRSDKFLTEDRGRLRNAFNKVLFYTHAVSFKTGIYVFYIAVLIVSRASILEPEIINPYLRTFIHSVEYGILLLLPLDKFFELLSKDDKRLHKIISRIGAKSRNRGFE